MGLTLWPLKLVSKKGYQRNFKVENNNPNTQDMNNCKVLYIKNLPVINTGDVLKKLIKDKTGIDPASDFEIKVLEENNITKMTCAGSHVIFKTHIEAALVMKELSGCLVEGKRLGVEYVRDYKGTNQIDSVKSKDVQDGVKKTPLTKTVNTQDLCKVILIKNLPQTNPADVLKRLIMHILGSYSAKCIEIFDLEETEIQYTSEKIFTCIQCKVKFPTHAEAAFVLKALSGYTVEGTTDKLRVEYFKGEIFQNSKQTKRKLVAGEAQEFMESKKSKPDSVSTKSNVANTKFNLASEKSEYDTYGLSPKLLEELGLDLPLKTTICVTELHEMVTEHKLYEVFSLAGEIKNLEYRISNCAAKIEYDHPVEAVQAIRMFHSHILFDKKMHVAMVSGKQSWPEGLSSAGAAMDIKETTQQDGKSYNKYAAALKEICEILKERGLIPPSAVCTDVKDIIRVL